MENSKAETEKQLNKIFSYVFDSEYIDGTAISETNTYSWLVKRLEKEDPKFKSSPFNEPTLLNLAYDLHNYQDPAVRFDDSERVFSALNDNDKFNISTETLALLFSYYCIPGEWKCLDAEEAEIEFNDEELENTEYFVEENSKARLTFYQFCKLLEEFLMYEVAIKEKKIFRLMRQIPLSEIVEELIGGDDGEVNEYEIDSLQMTLDGILG